MRLPCGQHPLHSRRILGMPHRRTPIRCHDDEPPARPQHPVDLPQAGVEIGQILEHLHGKNGVERSVRVGRRGNIRGAAFDPAKLGASPLRCRDLVGADVDRADLPGPADKSGGLISVIATTATEFNTRAPVRRLSASRTVLRRTTRSCDPAIACCRRAMSPVNASALMPPSL